MHQDRMIPVAVACEDEAGVRAIDDAMAGRRGYAIIWEYNSNRRQWSVTVGEWHAVAQRVAGAHYAWQAASERTTAPHDRFEGPTYTEAMDARTWCLRKIVELAGAPL